MFHIDVSQLDHRPRQHRRYGGEFLGEYQAGGIILVLGPSQRE